MYKWLHVAPNYLKLRILGNDEHCVKKVRIWSCSGPYFSAFGLNTERSYFLSVYEIRKYKMQSISLYSVRMWEKTDQNNSEYGYISCSGTFNKNPKMPAIKAKYQLFSINEHFDSCARKLQSIASKTFQRKIYFARFGEFICNILSVIVDKKYYSNFRFNCIKDKKCLIRAENTTFLSA